MKFKLAVPLNAAGEAEILFNAGASEFYCGLQTDEWIAKFGDHDSISRRQGAANLSSFEELKKIISECSALDAPLFLTLNGGYTNEQLPHVYETAEKFEAAGGTGVMAADLSLLIFLQKTESKLMRGLSLMAAAGSAGALGFYKNLGVQRVVFPRFLPAKQIKTIMEKYPEITGESLVWLDMCRFIDGYCRFLHTTGYVDARGGDFGCLNEVYSYDTNYRIPACFNFFGAPPKTPACGVCGMEILSDAGIRIFKMGGRGRPLETRLTGVKFINTAADLIDNAVKKKLYEETFGEACGKDACYCAQRND